MTDLVVRTVPGDQPPPLVDARHLKLIHRMWVIPPRWRAHTKPQPCVCPGPYYHLFCWVVTCKCDHGIGAR